MTPSLTLWTAAGSPVYPATQQGRCRLCGSAGTGEDFPFWVRDTFTDHDKLLPGSIICQACQFCCADSNTTLTQRLGKDKPQRMRNYSHFVLDGQWLPLSKGDKRRMREILMQSPEVAIIAESGQKHIIFRARLGWWILEEHRLEPCPLLLSNLLLLIEPLYQGGASKAEIESGHYTQKSIQNIGIGTWAAHEQGLRAWRGGLPFKLAIFLAQKEEKSDDAGATCR